MVKSKTNEKIKVNIIKKVKQNKKTQLTRYFNFIKYWLWNAAHMRESNMPPWDLVK